MTMAEGSGGTCQAQVCIAACAASHSPVASRLYAVPPPPATKVFTKVILVPWSLPCDLAALSVCPAVVHPSPLSP